MRISWNRATATAVAIALGVLVVVGALVYRNNQRPCIPILDKVQRGETLEGIAKEYLNRHGEPYDYVDLKNFMVDIQTASGLNSNQVHTDQSIAIPNLGC